MSAVQQVTVDADEAGMRLDRWFAVHFPQVGFGRLQKLIRTGQVRVDKAKVETSTRLEAGQVVRVPPVDDPGTVRPPRIDDADARFLREPDPLRGRRPLRLQQAVRPGRAGWHRYDATYRRHAEELAQQEGRAAAPGAPARPRYVGCLVVAKTHAAASHFGAVFRSRSARKIYWAVVVFNPKPPQGEISCFLAKQATTDGEQMVVVKQGHPGAQHSLTYYSTTDTASRRFAWVTLKPATGRTHQLRVHMAQLGTPIIGDPRYFNIENWEGAPGLSEGLHLHARRIALPLRNGKVLDISAPLPPHMRQSFEALGFDPDRYDVQDTDPEEAA